MSQSRSPTIAFAYPPWLHWLEQCPSTNTWAIDHFSTLQHGDVVFTRQQTAGRGQQGRIWRSPPGVLTASIVLFIPTEHLPGLSLAAGLAVIYAIEDLTNLREALRLKWPNDVMLRERKLAGILCESVVNHHNSQVVVGIGLNRCVDFAQPGLDQPGREDSLLQKTISLHQVGAIVPDEFSLLERLRHYLLETAGLLRSSVHHSSLTVLLPALRQRDFLLGKSITVELSREQIVGTAMGISDRGELLLRLADGGLRAFTSGHVLW